jgi:hypothetical protein
VHAEQLGGHADEVELMMIDGHARPPECLRSSVAIDMTHVKLVI